MRSFAVTTYWRSIPFFTFFALVIYLYISFLADSSLWSNSPSTSSSSALRSVRGSSSSSLLAEATPLNYRKPLVMPGRPIVPSIIYGTAWKKDRTTDLVELAVRTGFRGIDTACQPKHYYEKGVGDALRRLYAAGVVKREDLFLQTKFTSLDGQDPQSIPYDRTAPLREQVLQSFAKSCENLQTTYLDSLVMHSPMHTVADTITVWRVFEELYRQGGVKYLGLSNTYNLNILRQVYDAAEIKPSFLQNRFYKQSGYDKEIRQFCQQHNIVYQSFWTLTANPQILQHPSMASLCKKYQKTPPQVMYRFVQSLGIVPLDGTTNEAHMVEDLDLNSFSLLPEEVESLNALL